MIYLLNALPNSLFRLPLEARPISEEEAKALLVNGFTSYVGHRSTARVYSQRLGVEVGVNRAWYTPCSGDKVLAGLFTAYQRLEEGQSWDPKDIVQLPINWVLVSFE